MLRAMKYLALTAIALIAACKTESNLNSETNIQESIIIQGHRGCRGVLPENSLQAFEKAMEIGVSVLELDVVVTKDKRLIVSHEPWMNPEICTMPDGSELISEQEGKEFNIYQMNLEEAQSYRFGSFGHHRFPDQQKQDCHKPTLSEVVAFAQRKSKELGTPLPGFNVELKSTADGGGIFYPTPSEYADIFMQEFELLDITELTTIQSFDARLLRELHTRNTAFRLVYLVEPGLKSYRRHIEDLGFSPYGFSPNHKVVTAQTVKNCKEDGVHLSVWTVNESKDIEKMIELGVRDIISDYPSRAIEIAEKKGLITQR